MNPTLEAQVADQLARGEIVAAAALLEAAKQWQRAAELRASVWQYREAVTLAKRADDLPGAYRYAALGGLDAERHELFQSLLERPEQAAQAAPIAERLGWPIEAAELLAAGGQVLLAARRLSEQGAARRGAGLLEQHGHHREAGVAYERALQVEEDDGQAVLGLGRVLARFGRFEDALRSLQRADALLAGSDRDEASVWMIGCFLELGWRHAVSEQLSMLRSRNPAFPRDAVEVLQNFLGQRALPRVADVDGTEELLLGRYRVVRALGAGVTGRVFLAEDLVFGHSVAIKALTVFEGGRGREAYERFQREAELAAKLAHPAIVRSFAYHPSGPLMVMEYLAGGSLRRRMAEGPLDVAFVQRVCAAILAGLAEVHRHGVVHRDLKPENVLLGDDGNAKIADFGVVHLREHGATVTGDVFGTLAYMAPEQLAASGPLGPEADLFSFGVLLFELLTGSLPFAPEERLLRRRVVPCLTSLKAEGSELAPFAPLLETLLAPDRADRPTDAAGVSRQLAALPWPGELPWEPQASLVGRLQSEANRFDAELQGPRYRNHRPNAAETRLAEDAWLKRTVELRSASTGERKHLRELAQAAPWAFQQVWTETEEYLVLEWISGPRLSELEPDERLCARVRDTLVPALQDLAAAGLQHGQVHRQRIWVSETRVVLRLPEGPARTSPESDLEALQRIASP